MLNGTRCSAPKADSATMFQSLVVRMVGPARLAPALAPAYGMPVRERSRIASTRPELRTRSSSAYVLPPPTKSASTRSSVFSGCRSQCTWMEQLTAVEFGALDGLTADEIARAAPGADDHTLVSRLRDGGEVTLGKTWTRDRLAALMERLDADAFDLIVLLCTGHFEGVR